MDLQDVVVVDTLRSPIGKHRGGLARKRPDDLAAEVLGALLDRHPQAKADVEELVFGATNQAGEDNRNIARMAGLLAGLPMEVTGVTVNRLCGSGLEALIQCARAIRLGDHEVMVAGGVESMSRAPFSMPRADEAFPRKAPVAYDTALGWRFPNPKMAERIPLISMGETAENVAEEYGVSRADQDAFAAKSHQKAAAAWEAGRFAGEVLPITVPPAHKRAEATILARDESIRPGSTPEILGKLRPVFREGGSVTAGNSSPLNAGAAAVLLARRAWCARHVRKRQRASVSTTTGSRRVSRSAVSPRTSASVRSSSAFCSRSAADDSSAVSISRISSAVASPNTTLQSISCRGSRASSRRDSSWILSFIGLVLLRPPEAGSAHGRAPSSPR